MMIASKKWTVITAILTMFAYIDAYFLFSIYFITVPVAVLAAVIAMFISIKEKQSLYLIVNIALAVVAMMLFIVIPM